MGAFDDGTLSTALEVYRSKEYSVTIVQQRAPLMKGTTATYIQELSNWIKEVQKILFGSLANFIIRFLFFVL